MILILFGSSQIASKRVSLVGALHDGRLIGFDAPVLGEDPGAPETSLVPPLYSLTQLADDNAYMHCKTGRIFMPPEEVAVSWPESTRVLQCEKAPGGHWTLGVNHWDKVSPAEAKRVRDIRARA